MTADFILLPDEEIIWEAKPAPRCYAFKNWRLSILGLLLILLAVYAEVIGVGQSEVFGPALLRGVVLLIFLLGLWLAIGQVLWARREWERVFYAASDRRLLMQRGLMRPVLQSMDLASVSGYRLHVLGQDLAWVQVFGQTDEQTLNFHCLEHPRRLTRILEKAMAEGPFPGLVFPRRAEGG